MSEPTHFALALAAFMMFFATIGPVDCAIIFATLTSKQSRTSQSRMALKSCAIAGGPDRSLNEAMQHRLVDRFGCIVAYGTPMGGSRQSCSRASPPLSVEARLPRPAPLWALR